MAARRCLQMVFVWTEVLTVILLGYRFGSAEQLPLRAPCNIAKMEITYPRVVDIKGEQSRSWTIGAPLPGSVRILFTWRNRQRLLRLFRNEVGAKKMVVVYEDNSRNDTVAELGMGDNCFYVGFLKGEHSSYAAVSTCLGLGGYIQTDEELLFIAPAVPRREEIKLWGQRPHVIYTCSTSDGSTGIGNGGNASSENEAQPERSPVRPARRKRAVQDKKKYLEVMLVVDHTITAMHGKDRVKNYVMTLMNIANSVYQHHTLGANIRVVVTEIVLLDKDDQKRVLTKKDAYRTVQQFCQWTMHRLSPRHSAKHDVAVLLTRESLGPAGYAPITGLCDPSRSCAAVTDEGFTTGFIIAHETAHIFGLFHDGHGNTCTGRRYTTAIMAPLVEAKLNHYWWSECSKQRMQEVISYLYCLNDEPDMISGTPSHYELDSGSVLHDQIGKDYSLQFQCRLEFGHEFIMCAAFEMDACNMLWCSERSAPNMCRTKRGPPMPGSNCGHQRQCRNNQCAYVGNEKPVHGNWGDWEEWGTCSVDCGVGIRRRRRSCINPQPAYGGRDCEGNSEDWDTCLNKDCSQYQDSREAHCAVWSDLNVRPGQHDWLPYQTSKESERCKQTCVSNRTGEIVTIPIEISDGTPCTYEEPTNICYLGSCLKVGCDGVRNSTKEYDACGVCGGNNSECKTVSGHFKRILSTKEEYETIVLVPKGARNIEVTKRGINKHFLALRDPRYGTFPLNGDKKRGNSRDVIVGGARFVYKSVNFLQTIKSSGPLYFEMEIMIYPNKDNSEASVTYEYTVNRKDMTLERRKYQWKFHNWTQCSVTCGDGVMHIEHACLDKDTGLEVSRDKCEYLDPPRRDEAPCNSGSCTMTRYTWAMTNDWSSCDSSECGRDGVEMQGYKCELYYMNNDTYEKADMDLCDPNTAPIVTQPCTGPPCNLNWTAGNWSECSVTCGKGRQSRTVYCGDPATDADDMKCKDKPPRSSRPCEVKACEETASDDACNDKYAFCSRAIGLNVKCQSDRFRQICCKACRDLGSAATRPHLSQWTLYRQRMLKAKSKRMTT